MVVQKAEINHRRKVEADATESTKRNPREESFSAHIISDSALARSRNSVLQDRSSGAQIPSLDWDRAIALPSPFGASPGDSFAHSELQWLSPRDALGCYLKGSKLYNKVSEAPSK